MITLPPIHSPRFSASQCFVWPTPTVSYQLNLTEIELPSTDHRAVVKTLAEGSLKGNGRFDGVDVSVVRWADRKGLLNTNVDEPVTTVDFTHVDRYTRQEDIDARAGGPTAFDDDEDTLPAATLVEAGKKLTYFVDDDGTVLNVRQRKEWQRLDDNSKPILEGNLLTEPQKTALQHIVRWIYRDGF